MERLSHRTFRDVASRATLPPPAALDAAIGIAHLGLGGFHRAHQAILTQRALDVAPGPWAISGTSLRSAAVRDALLPQDCLYTLVENDGTEERASVVGVVHEALFAPEDGRRLLDRLAAPSTRIVTVTVTEKGYCHNPATGELDLAHPDIEADLGPGDPPRSTLGWLVRGLEQRRAARAGGLTVLCCDNMARNGSTLHGLGPQFAQRVDPDLAAWIEDEVRFPNSMVDRIVPAATAASLDHAAELLGLRDEAAVRAEAFVQWVIEDEFAAGRPRWEVAGAELVQDVRPYQELKLRLLNGAHSAIAYLGALVGKPFVADVMADPELARFIRRLMLEDIAPLTPAPPGFDIEGYVQALLQRFANGSLQHRTCRSPWTARRRSRCAGSPCCARPGDAGHQSRTSSLRSPFGCNSSRAATKPAGTCRSTTRWRPACAPLLRPSPATRPPWSGRRWRSRRCSVLTCDAMMRCRRN